MDLKKRLPLSEIERMSKPELVSLVNQLFDIIEQLVPQSVILSEKVETLEQKISALGDDKSLPKKHSNNSSQSPATDLARKRKKGPGKHKMGPPLGHEGKSRKIVENPNIILDIPIKNCPRTAKEIHSQSKSYKRHQILELEPVKVIVIEIRRQITTGPDGKTVIAPHPEGVKRYKRYGANLKTHIAYMKYEQNLPWSKIWNYFQAIAGIHIGIGTLQSIFNELKDDLEQEYNDLKEEVKQAKVVGCDETGFHVNGKKWWIHLIRTKDTSIFTASESRGHKVLQDILGKDFPGWIVSDFWGAYNPKFYPNAKFQKCVAAHLLRDLAYAIECEQGKGDYAQQLFNIFFEAIILRKYFIFGTDEYQVECQEKESRLEALLKDDINTVSKEGKKLWKRLRKYRSHLLNFLYNEELPFDNNGSERDIRDMVNNRKISGGCKTPLGIKILAMVKSIISTYKKRKADFVRRMEMAFGKTVFDSI